MRILTVSYDVPRPDHNSGELRFFTLLSLLALDHDVTFLSMAQQICTEREAAVKNLKTLGINVERQGFESLLRRAHFDLVFFEFYYIAEPLIDIVHAWQPRAKILVDSVDVHFHRLRSKAMLTGLPSDHAAAETVRRREVKVYGKADMVLTVSDEDAQILKRECLASEIVVIPNIHVMHPLGERQHSARLELIFIGSYKHAPNIDAMLYFCTEVMPLLRKHLPSLRLRILGSEPTPEVRALACTDIEVVGFVESTTPYLLSSDISVAPLRYGGGIKGKIGEALAHGVPVVTTSVGAEGFGFECGKQVLVEDSPEGFADSVLRLWRDRCLYEKVRNHGWHFIDERYSVQAVSRMLPSLMRQVEYMHVKRLAALKRAVVIVRHYTEKYVLWRFRR